MKKGIIVTATILIFFIITINSNAEMRITPDGIESPNGSTSLRLSGSFSNGPDGNVITYISHDESIGFRIMWNQDF